MVLLYPGYLFIRLFRAGEKTKTKSFCGGGGCCVLYVMLYVMLYNSDDDRSITMLLLLLLMGHRSPLQVLVYVYGDRSTSRSPAVSIYFTCNHIYL